MLSSSLRMYLKEKTREINTPRKAETFHFVTAFPVNRGNKNLCQLYDQLLEEDDNRYLFDRIFHEGQNLVN